MELTPRFLLRNKKGNDYLEIPWYFNFSNLPLKGSAKFSFFRKILSFVSEFSFHLEQYRQFYNLTMSSTTNFVLVRNF